MIIGPERQLDRVKGVSSWRDYFEIFHEYFNEVPRSPWEIYVRRFLKENNLLDSVEFARLLTVSATLARQMGFETVDASEYHKSKEWKKLHLSLEHQLAQLCYLGKVTYNASFSRSSWMKEIEHDDLKVGVWGIKPWVSGGKIRGYSHKRETLEQMASSALSGNRPVLLPTPALSSFLSTIGFTGEDAEVITMDRLGSEIVPSFRQVLVGLVNIDKVYADFNRPRLIA